MRRRRLSNNISSLLDKWTTTTGLCLLTLSLMPFSLFSRLPSALLDSAIGHSDLSHVISFLYCVHELFFFFFFFFSYPSVYVIIYKKHSLFQAVVLYILYALIP